jgi:hypothetical protein
VSRRQPRRDARDRYRESPTWDDRADEFEAHPWWVTLKWVVGVLVLVLVVAALVGVATTGSVFFEGEAAKHTVNSRTDKQVYSPENKQAQIAFFHNTCQDVNSQLAVIRNAQQTLATDEAAAKDVSDPLQQQVAIKNITTDQQDLSAARDVAAKSAADYNSRSAQSTANVFKDAGLPDRITLPNPIPDGYSVDCG